MLGSVYERTKEIGTYSAVGLAPSHISALFLAESTVYATVGAITGYLLGQIASKLITEFHLLPGLILNYSSMSAVYTCGIVVITVIVSTIFPAIKASQMAVPDVSRRWKFPQPQGNNLIFELPFTVNKKDILPINGFLLSYFRAHTEASLGGFYTEKVTLSKISTEHGEGLRQELTVWIVPFELGISQKVTIDTLPTEDKDIYGIKFNIERKSGEFSTWSRVNRGFLDGIRKQFLIWRTITEEGKENYRKEGERELL
jgi:predicted lysophospholipase L1 biosynthesis ABC-type transport system permease subunit